MGAAGEEERQGRTVTPINSENTGVKQDCGYNGTRTCTLEDGFPTGRRSQRAFLRLSQQPHWDPDRVGEAFTAAVPAIAYMAGLVSRSFFRFPAEMGYPLG